MIVKNVSPHIMEPRDFDCVNISSYVVSDPTVLTGPVHSPEFAAFPIMLS